MIKIINVKSSILSLIVSFVLLVTDIFLYFRIEPDSVLTWAIVIVFALASVLCLFFSVVSIINNNKIKIGFNEQEKIALTEDTIKKIIKKRVSSSAKTLIVISIITGVISLCLITYGIYTLVNFNVLKIPITLTVAIFVFSIVMSCMAISKKLSNDITINEISTTTLKEIGTDVIIHRADIDRTRTVKYYIFENIPYKFKEHNLISKLSNHKVGDTYYCVKIQNKKGVENIYLFDSNWYHLP